MFAFLKLIRYQNLILIALMQCLLHYGFLKFQTPVLALDHLHFAALVLSCLCIAAGGYIINNIVDVEADSENKPQSIIVGKSISEKAAYNWYFALNIIGMGIAYYLCNHIDRWNFIIIFALVAYTLYLYATSFKGQLIIGNLLVALILCVSVIIVGVFDLIPVIFTHNKSLIALLFDIVIDYAVFAFLLNFLREIVKDIEDVDGDYNQGMNTLPIALGVGRTAILAGALGVICAIILGWYLYAYMFGLLYVVLYAIIFLISPLLFFSFKMFDAKKKADFYFAGQLLKWIIFFGILSIRVVTFNMQLNAGAIS